MKKEIKALVQNIDGKLLAVASDETIDRVGDKLDPEKFDLKNFKKNPVLQWAHRYDIPPVGIAKNIKVDGNKLLFEPVFHNITEMAREVAQLFMEGILKAFSVGYITREDGTMELLEISAVPVPANPNALMIEKSLGEALVKNSDVKSWISAYITKGVIPYSIHGDSEKADEDTEWDAGKEVGKADVEQLKKMCAWFDSENADVKSSYKLPHHLADGNKVVWNGVKAAMGALLGARGGVDIPDADKRGVYNHLKKHYDQFDKEAPEFRDIEIACDVLNHFNIDIKEGRVLSKSNLERIKQAITVLQDLVSMVESNNEPKAIKKIDDKKSIIKSRPASDDPKIIKSALVKMSNQLGYLTRIISEK